MATTTDSTPWLQKEFRACGTYTLPSNPGETLTETGEWHTDRSQAVRDLGNLEATHPPFRRTWLEGRFVTAPTELVVVLEDAVTPTPGMEAFLAALEGRAA